MGFGTQPLTPPFRLLLHWRVLDLPAVSAQGWCGVRTRSTQQLLCFCEALASKVVGGFSRLAHVSKSAGVGLRLVSSDKKLLATLCVRLRLLPPLNRLGELIDLAETLRHSGHHASAVRKCHAYFPET